MGHVWGVGVEVIYSQLGWEDPILGRDWVSWTVGGGGKALTSKSPLSFISKWHPPCIMLPQVNGSL